MHGIHNRSSDLFLLKLISNNSFSFQTLWPKLKTRRDLIIQLCLQAGMIYDYIRSVLTVLNVVPIFNPYTSRCGGW